MATQRNGIKTSIGFLFAIVAGLVVEDFLAGLSRNIQSDIGPKEIFLEIAAGTYLFRMVFDCFIYYEQSEKAPVTWPAYILAMIFGFLEASTLFWIYDLAHALDTIRAHTVPYLDVCQRVLRAVFACELTWVVWDVVWWYHLGIKWRRAGNCPEKKRDYYMLARWFAFNTIWSGIFAIGWLSPTLQNCGTYASLAVALMIVVCALSYVTSMRRYYSGHFLGSIRRGHE